MEIKSSLLNEESMSLVKDSLMQVSEKDGKGKFRVDLVEYVNYSADNNDDEFFYDMLEFLRFLDPSEDTVAYTDRYHLIWLNAPDGGEIGEKIRPWDFVYCHECLHQLWDTFGVEDKLKEEGYDVNHMLLNIASDCVINDYLSYYRKKESLDGGVTPEYLEKNYNVIYDRKNDTQYTLYLKLIEKEKELEKDEKLQKESREFDKKLKPKDVKKESGSAQGGGGLSPKHSKDYIKGYTDAIQDTLDNKIDPLKDSPKKTGNDEYDKGYADALSKIKEGLEDGITINSNANITSGSGGQSDLPNIPWDVKNDNPSGNSGNGKNSDKQSEKDSKENSKEDSQKSPEEEAQEAAEKAKDSADKAQEAADKAKEKAADSGSAKDKKLADEAQKEADEAKKEAEKAKEAAKEAKKEGSQGNKKAAEKAAEKAKDAADKAQRASLRAQSKSPSSNTEQNKSEQGKQIKAHSTKKLNTSERKNTISDVDLSEIKKNAEEIITKYKQKISGYLGTFVKKCKSSVELEKNGLMIKGIKGSSGWAQKLTSNIIQFTKNKVFQKRKEYKRTYQRMKRGSGFVEFGQPIQKGKKLKDDKITISVAFYVDRSGSMGATIDNVFKTAYTIGESLKKQFSKDKVVDKCEFRMFAFDDSIEEIPWGKKVNARGGNLSMEDYLKNIEDKTGNYLINVFITDGQFNIDEKTVKEFIQSLYGCFIYVSNMESQTTTVMKTLSKDHKFSTKLYYIEADEYFSLN